MNGCSITGALLESDCTLGDYSSTVKVPYEITALDDRMLMATSVWSRGSAV